MVHSHALSTRYPLLHHQNKAKATAESIPKSVGRVASFVRQCLTKKRAISSKSKATSNEKAPNEAAYLRGDGRKGEGEEGGDERAHLARI